MQKTGLWLLVPCAMMLSSSVAGAQTFSMDRQRAQNELGIRMDFGFAKQAGEVTSDESYFRAEVHGQLYMNDWGAYLSLPMARSMSSLDGASLNTALGNLELGGFHNMTMKWMDLILRFGAVVPTADRDVKAFGTSALANYGRVTDHINVQPGIIGVRASASPVLDWGVIFLKADVGVDMVFGVGDEPTVDRFQSYFRGNIGLGANFGIVSIAVESVNLVTMADSKLMFGSRQRGQSIHAITGGLWAHLGWIHPYVSFSAPVDALSQRDYGFVFTLGADVRI